MAGALSNPFDGEPPDSLLEDFQEQLTAILEDCEPMLERLRSLGCSGILIVNSYDPLADLSHNQWRTFGNKHAVWGALLDYQNTQANQ